MVISYGTDNAVPATVCSVLYIYIDYLAYPVLGVNVNSTGMDLPIAFM